MMLVRIMALLMLVTSANAQSVMQSGSITPGHVTRWISNGVVGDGGTAANGFLTSLGVTNNGGPGVCVKSAPITSPYNILCLAATTSGLGKISYYAFNGATNPGLTFDINGTIGLPVASLASVDAATILGNPTALSAVPQAFTIQGLTARGAPDANNDKLVLYDNAAGVLKYVTPGLIAAAATAGVSSFGGVVGAITIDTAFLTMSGSQLTLANNGITNAKLATMAANTIKGNNTGSSATPLDLTVAQTQALLQGNYNTPSAANPVSANYTAVTGDCGGTINLTGNFYTLTVNAASGYATQCVIVVKNSSSTRGKRITVSGYSSCILWPLQEVVLRNVASTWQWGGCYLWYWPGSNQFYVDPSNGNDNNDGLAPTTDAFLTIGAAINTVHNSILGRGGNVGINLANGTYNEHVFCAGLGQGLSEISLIGNAASPASVSWSGPVGSTPLTVRDGCIMNLDGIALIASGNGVGVSVDQLGVIDVNNIYIAAPGAAGYGILIGPGGYMTILAGSSGGVHFQGGAYNSMFYVGGKLSVVNQNITIDSGAVLTQFIAVPGGNASFVGTTDIVGGGAGAASTGAKCNVTDFGVLYLPGSGSTNFPGNTACVVTGSSSGPGIIH